jgi:hypothetical protein
MGIAVSFGVGSIISMVLQPMPVDFKLGGMPPPPTTTQGSRPLVPPEGQGASCAKPRMPPVHANAAIAVGFGRDVPLEFAVRQVAPRWVRVSYGESVDRQVRISWRGGRPWTQVLGRVLTPLGLHMTMSGHTLWIRG